MCSDPTPHINVHKMHCKHAVVPILTPVWVQHRTSWQIYPAQTHFLHILSNSPKKQGFLNKNGCKKQSCIQLISVEMIWKYHQSVSRENINVHWWYVNMQSVICKCALKMTEMCTTTMCRLFGIFQESMTKDQWGNTYAEENFSLYHYAHLCQNISS